MIFLDANNLFNITKHNNNKDRLINIRALLNKIKTKSYNKNI